MELDEDDFSCVVCTQMYADGEKSPLMLQCGHTLCKECVLAIKQTNNLCGECRSPISTYDINDLPINYALIRVMETLRRGQTPHMMECKEFKVNIGNQINNLNDYRKLYEDRKINLLSEINKWQAYKESLRTLKADVELLDQELPVTKNCKDKIEQLLNNASCKIDYYNTRIIALNNKIGRVKSFKKVKENKLAKVQDSIIALMKCKSLLELSKIVQETEGLLGLGDLENKFKLDIQFDLAEEDFIPLMTSPKDYCIKHSEEFYSSLHVLRGKVLMKSSQNSGSITGVTKCIDATAIEPYATGAYLRVESHGLEATLEFELYDGCDSKAFALLCSGVKGKCLTNSSLFNYDRVGLEGANVSLGFLSYSTKKRVKCSTSKYIKTGYLVGPDDGTSVFKIYLDDWPPIYTNNCLGRLLSGFTFLKKCVNNGYPIRIYESGLIYDFKKKVELERKGFMTS